MTKELSMRRRGKGKKLALFLTSIRLDSEVLTYFREYYPTTMQAQMREVLAAYVQTKTQGEQDGEVN